MISNCEDLHPVVYHNGVLGVTGYSDSNFFCVTAGGGNHFLHYGIAENSLLIADPRKPFRKGKLNVFQLFSAAENELKLKLSLTREDGIYMGRVVMTVNQYT